MLSNGDGYVRHGGGHSTARGLGISILRFNIAAFEDKVGFLDLGFVLVSGTMVGPSSIPVFILVLVLVLAKFKIEKEMNVKARGRKTGG